MRRYARSSSATVLALVALTVTGCGSTVQSSGSLGAAGATSGLAAPTNGIGAAPAPGTGAGDVTGTGGTRAGEAGATAAGPGGGGAGAAAVAGGGAGAPRSASGPTTTSGARIGPGVTATEVLVGRTRVLNAAALNSAFGNNIESAPTDSYDKAVVDYVNGHGGLAGRKIKLVYYTLDASANKDQDTVEQEECAAWTQDHRVFAVLQGDTGNLRSCLAKKGVPQVYENVFSDSDDKTFSTFRSYYEINAIGLSALGDAMPQQLAAGGYFTAGSKVGILTFDTNQHVRAVKEHLKPALARIGHTSAMEAYVKPPRTAAEESDTMSSLPGIVLQFKQAGVDHLLVFGDSGAALLVYFSKNAKSQDYHPAYGITSASGPQVVIDQGLMDASELHGSVAAGWNPVGDVGSRPYTKYGAGYQRCASIMKRAGITIDGNDNNKVIALKTCDAFFFLADAINRTAPDITLQSFMAGAEATDTSYVSSLSYATSITATHRDGVAELATNVFSESCSCFTYRGGLRRLR